MRECREYIFLVKILQISLSKDDIFFLEASSHPLFVEIFTFVIHV